MASARFSADLADHYIFSIVTSNYFSLLLIAFLLGTISLGCSPIAGHVAAQTDQSAALDLSPFENTSMPLDSANVAYQGLARNPIIRFYSERDGEVFWTSRNKPTAQGDSLIDFIRNVRYYGLTPSNYFLNEIEALRGELASPTNIFRFEALLTASYFLIVHDISDGRTSEITPRSDSVAVQLLHETSARGGLVANITLNESTSPGYRSLKQGLKLFIDSLSEHQLTEISNASVATSSEVGSRFKTVEVNLERWRLERKSWGSRYVFVNIPEFTLYMVENDSVVLQSKVIVGTPETQTPELSSLIECFVTYPYWHVPRKIAVEEYLPVIQVDTSFLTRNFFDVLDKKGNVLNKDSIDWSRFSKNYFPVVLRQRHGAENSLGIIKFIFDNPHAVFLHDTNARRLFNSKSRAFSHGCIRMEKAIELAHILVTGAPGRESKYISKFLKE
ncbi:MAG TPA: L,D-transpeptidase family protein, partial [Chryseosolibacter sp.]